MSISLIFFYLCKYCSYTILEIHTPKLLILTQSRYILHGLVALSMGKLIWSNSDYKILCDFYEIFLKILNHRREYGDTHRVEIYCILTPVSTNKLANPTCRNFHGRCHKKLLLNCKEWSPLARLNFPREF